MAFEDYDAYEQSEKVQQWLRENGIAIVAGVVLALVLIFGWRQWQAHNNRHHVQAAASYADLQSALANANETAMGKAMDNLRDNFSDTPYAPFAAAAMAEYEVGKGKLKQAGQHLQWAVDHSPTPGLHALFTVRLARVDVAQGQAQQALTLLGGITDGGYATLVDELRGDALLKLGKTDAARNAYNAALAALDEDAPQRGVLKMKLDDLTQPKVAQPGKQGT